MKIGRGLSIWYEKKSGNTASDPKAHLHFNFWRLPSPNLIESFFSIVRLHPPYPKSDFLDIGLKVENAAAIESLSIYIPYKDLGVTDLGPLFKSPDIAVGVFNEKLKPTLENKYIDLDYSHGSEPFARIFQFADSENGFDSQELEIDHRGTGTIIKICERAFGRALEGIEADRPIYFRLRFSLSESFPFLKERKPGDRWVQSGFDTIEYVDFRVNQKRSMPDDVERSMYDNNNFPLPFYRVDFLLVIDVTDEIVGDNSIFHKNRILEDELWGEYLGNEKIIRKGMVIYHTKMWGKEIDRPDNTKALKEDKKERKPIEEYSAFIKMRVRRTGLKTLAIFALVAVVLGLLAEFVAGANWFPTWGGIFDESSQITVDQSADVNKSEENSGDKVKNDS